MYTYEAAVDALMSPLHQAADKESLQKSAARRIWTVKDMRKYWNRIQWNNNNDNNNDITTTNNTQSTPAGNGPTKSLQPQRMIHITGTKGKGSTASLCQAILQSHGYTTGLFTSPHLIDIRERIRIDGRPIHANMFAKAYWKIRQDLEKDNHGHSRTSGDNDDDDDDDLPTLPGYFRMLTLMAYYIFSQLHVDVWIIEVGMGGRYDATNFLDRGRARSICGVTLLDFDHTRVLGNTLEQIAWEKGGIFAVDKETTLNLTPKPSEQSSSSMSTENTMATNHDTVVVDIPDDPSYTCYILDSNTASVVNVFRQCASNEGRGAVLQLVDAKGSELRHALGKNPLGLAGGHQYGNATLAMHLCHAVITSKNVVDDDNDDSGKWIPTFEAFSKDAKTLKGLMDAQWPARCQTVVRPGSQFTFRLDGAHTPQSLTATMEWFLTGASLNPRRILIFNCSHERDPIELLEIAQRGNFTAVYFARSDSSRPSPVARETAKELLTAAGRTVHEAWITELREHPDQETWQETLGILWKHIVHKGMPGTATGASPGRHTQHYAVPGSCNKTSSKILNELSKTMIQPTEVLVTGSLYIVGSFLTALDWNEDTSPDLSNKLMDF